MGDAAIIKLIMEFLNAAEKKAAKEAAVRSALAAHDHKTFMEGFAIGFGVCIAIIALALVIVAIVRLTTRQSKID